MTTKRQISTTSFNPETGEVKPIKIKPIEREYPESSSLIPFLNEQLLTVEEYLSNYQAGFNILYSYFDYIPDELKPEVDKKLKELRL